MLYLAMSHPKKELIQLKEISENEGITEKYLEQIIIALRAANLVKSVRGAHGGYFLARDSEKITVREIIEKLEGSLFPVDCAEDPSICKRSGRCITIDVWKKVGDAVNQVLESITLKSLAKDFEKKNKSNMFYI